MLLKKQGHGEKQHISQSDLWDIIIAFYAEYCNSIFKFNNYLLQRIDIFQLKHLHILLVFNNFLPWCLYQNIIFNTDAFYLTDTDINRYFKNVSIFNDTDTLTITLLKAYILNFNINLNSIFFFSFRWISKMLCIKQ